MLGERGLVSIMLGLVIFMSTSKWIMAQEGLRPVTTTYALTNATIVQAPGRVIDKGTVIIKNGIIQSVGKQVPIPADASILPLDSMFIYAGFISGPSNIGVEKPKEREQKDDRKLTGSPTYERAGITPNVSVRSLLNPKEKSIAAYRKLGFTTTLALPPKGMIAGTGAIVLLGGSKNEDMLYKENVVMSSQLQGAGGVYPNTVIGVMAKYRDLYRKSQQAKDYERSYQANSNGMQRPDKDIVLEAMYPVVGGQLPVAFKTEDILAIHRVMALKKELGFNLILSEVKQGWDAIPAIKNSGTAVFLSYDLPELKEEKKKETEKKEETQEETKEKKNLSQEEIEREALEKRQREVIVRYYKQASQMADQSIKIGFSALEGKPKDFKNLLSKMIENGLSEDQALASLTTSPADILDVSNVMGSIDKGKLANLVISDKSYFDEKSNVRFVFVDGVKYEYEVKEKKKKSGGENVEVVGKWNYTAETPEGNADGIILIKGASGSYEGTVTLSYNDSTNEIINLIVEGSNLSFSFKTDIGEEITLDMSMNIDGDTFEGTLTVADFGSFPMQGERTEKPDQL